MIEFRDILNNRKKDLQETKENKPLIELKREVEDISLRENFHEAIFSEEDVCIICEYKPSSPSAITIFDLDVKGAVEIFETGGSNAISILTEKRFFKSGLNNLKRASIITELPLLRKDFILEEYQIYQAKINGASAVLLLLGIYPDLEQGLILCRDLEMDALVECKNRHEIQEAIKFGASIIGINNRNLEDFIIDLKKTEKMARSVPSEVTLVSESGVKTSEDVKFLASCGADALLVGTSVMAADNMLKKVEEMVGAGRGIRVVRE